MDASNERTAYPTLSKRPSTSELVRLFTLENHEIEWAFSVTTSSRTHHGLLCLLKVFQAVGRFVPHQDIPASIIFHISQQLQFDLPAAGSFTYATRTLRRHQNLVRRFLCVSKWDDASHQLVVKTMTTLASTCSKPADLVKGAIDALFRRHTELPALSTLRRLAGHTLQQNSDHLFEKITQRLSPSDEHQLDQLLDVPEGATESTFTTLCRSPGRPTRSNLRTLIDHVNCFDEIPDPQSPLAGIAKNKLAHWADEVNRLNAAELKAYRANRRRTLILSGLRDARAHLLDDMVTMLTKIMRKMRSRASDAVDIELKKKRASTEAHVELLLNVANDFNMLDDSTSLKTAVRQRFEEHGGVSAVITQCESRLDRRAHDWRQLVIPYFRNQRSLLMNLVETIHFKANEDFVPLLDALADIVAVRSSRADWMELDGDISFLGRAWHRHLVDLEYPRLYPRRTLEIAVFFTLVDALASGDVYVPGSKSYESYKDQLFDSEADPNALKAYLAETHLPADSQAFVRDLSERLARSAYCLDQAIYKEEYVALNHQGKPIIPRTSAIPPAESARQLEQEMLEKLPFRSILEALYNTDHWTRWTRHFGPPARMGPQIDNASERYVLTTFTYGCE